MAARGLIVAAPSSGTGKTTVTLGLLRALKRKGTRVSALKVGPDYIDPAFHAAATGRPAANLDRWAMRPEILADTVRRAAEGADLVLVEGVMGLFDGIGAEGIGSTAEVASILGWPVVMVLDARGAAASVAAMLGGFARHRADVVVAGAIVNRAGSINHADVIAAACMNSYPDVAFLGCMPRAPDFAIAERHLGLVQAGEQQNLAALIDGIADLIERHVDLAQLGHLAAPVPEWCATKREPAAPIRPIGQRIAVARDEAFSFCYDQVLEGWRREGAEITPFSPLADQTPDAWADAIYLPGGYPELHAAKLAGNSRFKAAMTRAADRGVAIYGECGGYMVLGKVLVDAGGTGYAMTGLLPLETSFAERRLNLGYRQAQLVAGGVIGSRGDSFRGHEFHYATILSEGPADPLFTATDAEGRRGFSAGLSVGRVAGSFIHLIDRVE